MGSDRPYSLIDLDEMEEAILARLDEYAETNDISRTEAAERLLDSALAGIFGSTVLTH